MGLSPVSAERKRTVSIQCLYNVLSINVTELMQSHDKTLTDEELLLMDEQRKWSLEMESTPGEEAV